MNNNHIIIILLIIIIVILAACLGLLFSQNFGKEDCKINIKCNESLSNGDKINIRLVDFNKTQIANKKISIKLKSDNTTKDYNLTTNENGLCVLTVTDLEDGNYVVNVTFDGDNHYKAANSHKKFTYSDEVSTSSISESSRESSSSTNPIDANRPTNNANYKGYNPYHESEVTSDGWNPSEHEVSRKTLSDGNQEIRYDDGYYRLVDENGYVITYGYRY